MHFDILPRGAGVPTLTDVPNMHSCTRNRTNYAELGACFLEMFMEICGILIRAGRGKLNRTCTAGEYGFVPKIMTFLESIQPQRIGNLSFSPTTAEYCLCSTESHADATERCACRTLTA